MASPFNRRTSPSLAASWTRQVTATRCTSSTPARTTGTYPPPPGIRHPEFDSKNIGHIYTTDFNSWYGPCDSACLMTPCGGLNRPDTCALKVRSGKFDEFHVWAPTIVQRGPTFWMFYTGVRREQI